MRVRISNVITCAAFTAAILNNQPMGFYQPFTLIKDAQRHGLKVLPIDITCSDWLCTIEREAVVGDAGEGRRGETRRYRIVWGSPLQFAPSRISRAPPRSTISLFVSA